MCAGEEQLQRQLSRWYRRQLGRGLVQEAVPSGRIHLCMRKGEEGLYGNAKVQVQMAQGDQMASSSAIEIPDTPARPPWEGCLPPRPPPPHAPPAINQKAVGGQSDDAG